MKLTLALTLLALTAAPMYSSAAQLIDFESPTYTNGELNGQGDFVTGAGTANGRWIVDSGRMTLTPGVGIGSGFSRFDANGSAIGLEPGSDLSNLVATGEIISFAMDVTLPDYDDTGNTILNIEVRGDRTGTFPGQLMSMQIRNNGLLRTSDTNFSDAIPSAGPNRIEVVLDFGESDYEIFVNGGSIAAFDFVDQGVNPPIIGLNHFRFNRVNNVDSLNNNIFFDNIAVAVIPEPGSLVLMGLAGLCMFKRSRPR